jgi:hypothetical protein
MLVVCMYVLTFCHLDLGQNNVTSGPLRRSPGAFQLGLEMSLFFFRVDHVFCCARRGHRYECKAST